MKSPNSLFQLQRSSTKCQILPWPSESPDVLSGHLHIALLLLSPVLPRVAQLYDHLLLRRSSWENCLCAPISLAHHCFQASHICSYHTLYSLVAFVCFDFQFLVCHRNHLFFKDKRNTFSLNLSLTSQDFCIWYRYLANNLCLHRSHPLDENLTY